MVDIHCHLLFEVDDGSDSIKESIDMLKLAKSQGIDAIILTPHYRYGMFPYDKAKILAHFKELLPYAGEAGVRIELGCEYHVNGEIVENLQSGRCLSLGGTRYVLTEYEYHTEFSYIKGNTEELLRQGFTPVIAHVERYRCMTDRLERAAELQAMGAYIQINCDAVLGIDGRESKRYTRKLLKAGMVNVIASDSHGIEDRVSHMDKCYTLLQKKFGEDEAERLMERTPRKIFEAKKIMPYEL